MNVILKKKNKKQKMTKRLGDVKFMVSMSIGVV